MYLLLYAYFSRLAALSGGILRYMPRRTKQGFDTKLYRSDTTCEGKRFFKTEAEALEAADFRMLENMSVTIGIYQCATCRNWHLTSIGLKQKTKRRKA